MNPKLTADRLGRRAIVYIRQSSMGQVMHNHESQRRQYGLVDRAYRMTVFPTQHLVVTGLYGYVRNPMYVAVASTILGQGLIFGNVKRAHTCDETIRDAQVGRPLAAPVQDKQLMPGQHGFGDHAADSARPCQPNHDANQLHQKD